MCNIFLASVDRDLHSSFDNETVLSVFRYVTDFLVVLKKQCSFNYHETANAILGTFNRHGKGLFTHEFPSHDNLQFLDINLIFYPTMFVGFIACVPGNSFCCMHLPIRRR